jgi:hypothetical protein
MLGVPLAAERAMRQSILRFVLGIVAGVAVMFVVIMGIELIGHRLYPPPPGIDPTRTADIAAMLAAAPLGALASIVIAWVCGAFAGGAVAAFVSRTWPKSAAIVVALLVLAGVIGMILQVPGHPRWMAMSGLLLPLPAALLGAWLARPRRAIPSR